MRNFSLFLISALLLAASAWGETFLNFTGTVYTESYGSFVIQTKKGLYTIELAKLDEAQQEKINSVMNTTQPIKIKIPTSAIIRSAPFSDDTRAPTKK